MEMSGMDKECVNLCKAINKGNYTFNYLKEELC